MPRSCARPIRFARSIRTRACFARRITETEIRETRNEMPAVVVVGAQWGDEGKGKIVDLIAEQAEMVVRYAGGANAGHTLKVAGQKIVTHLLPSGVLHPKTACVLGAGMVI